VAALNPCQQSIPSSIELLDSTRSIGAVGRVLPMACEPLGIEADLDQDGRVVTVPFAKLSRPVQRDVKEEAGRLETFLAD